MGDVKKVGDLTLALAESILKDYMEERKELHRWVYEANGWKFKDVVDIEDPNIAVMAGGESWFG